MITILFEIYEEILRQDAPLALEPAVRSYLSHAQPYIEVSIPNSIIAPYQYLIRNYFPQLLIDTKYDAVLISNMIREGAVSQN